MDPLSGTGSVIAILQLSGKVLGYLNDVKNASKERADCASEVLNLHNFFLGLISRLQEESSDELWRDRLNNLNTNNGPLDQIKQALEQLQSKLTGRGKSNMTRNALVWTFKKEEIASILRRMEHLKSHIQLLLELDHTKLSQSIKNDTTGIQRHIPAIQARTDKILQNQDDRKHDKVMTWISSMDFPAQQSDIISRKQEGTGQWFLDDPIFARWLCEPKGKLFCPGIPGAGKTMIAAIAVDHLLKTTQSSSVGIAYIYCDYKAQKEQDTVTLLAAILKHLVQAQPLFIEPAERLYQEHAKRGTKPSVTEIFTALQSTVARFSTVHIVIDALDECQDSNGTRHLFLAKLQDLQAKTDVRLMVTSRFIPGIIDKFKDALRLEVRASDEDVRKFVAGQTFRLPDRINRDAALQNIVQDKIVEVVDGMFLLARLHVDSLLDKRTKKKILSTLDRFSEGSEALELAYKDAIKRIEGQLSEDTALALRVLSWITYAQRPLTTAEIRHALGIELDEDSLDPDNILDIEDLVSVCAGLVVMDESSNIIRLIHYTTQEYFEHQMEWNSTPQLDITSTCLTYISFAVYGTGICSTEEELESRLQQNAFLEYAVRHWGQHAITVQEYVYQLACLFLLDSSSLSCAAQVMSVSHYKFSRYSKLYTQKQTGLHITARFGLQRLSEMLLYRSGRDSILSVDAIDSYGQTPLYIAASCGHEPMVKLLLDRGADVNIQGGLYNNALQVASHEGHEQIVELLLNRGADVRAQGSGHYGNALQTASNRGHKQIVELLLNRGAEVNVWGGLYGNALQAAAIIGHQQIVELLLNRGADVNAQGSRRYGNALQAASNRGHKRVVKLLHDQGASVNTQGGLYNNALQVASHEGHEQIVTMLLGKGADVNIQGGYYGNALQAASYRGHRQITELLLTKGADVNAQGGWYGNSLLAASAEGHVDIVKLLLDKGANVNAVGERYRNALQAASCGGYKRIEELLLSNGAHTNTQDVRSIEKTQAATSKSHENILNIVLERGFH